MHNASGWAEPLSNANTSQLTAIWCLHNFYGSRRFAVMPITTSQASLESGIPKRTIIAAITRGELPAQKLPGLTGAYLLDRDDLTIWLTGRT